MASKMIPNTLRGAPEPRARDVFQIKPGDNLIVLGDEALGGIALMKAELFLSNMEALLHAVSGPGKIEGDEDITDINEQREVRNEKLEARTEK